MRTSASSSMARRIRAGSVNRSTSVTATRIIIRSAGSAVCDSIGCTVTTALRASPSSVRTPRTAVRSCRFSSASSSVPRVSLLSSVNRRLTSAPTTSSEGHPSTPGAFCPHWSTFPALEMPSTRVLAEVSAMSDIPLLQP